MSKHFTIFFIVVFIIVAQCATAFAMNDAYRERHTKEVSKYMAAVSDLKTSITEGTSDPAMIEQYLSSAMFGIYHAKCLANSNFDQVVAETNDLESLVAGGYLPFWPENPFNGWKPMEILGVGEGFSAGDICFELCPPMYYSDISIGLTPVSFDIFIYGPDVSFESFGSVVQFKENKDWSVVPSGAIYGHSYYLQSDESLRIKREKKAAEAAAIAMETE